MVVFRILANENVPEETVEALRYLGHDVIWMRTYAPGTADEIVLAQAQEENRIVMTFDKDFGAGKRKAVNSSVPVSCLDS